MADTKPLETTQESGCFEQVAQANGHMDTWYYCRVACAHVLTH